TVDVADTIRSTVSATSTVPKMSPLLLGQGDILGTVDVAETVDLIVSGCHIHQELVVDRLGRLGALPAQALIELRVADGRGTANQQEEHLAPPALARKVVEEIHEPVILE